MLFRLTERVYSTRLIKGFAVVPMGGGEKFLSGKKGKGVNEDIGRHFSGGKHEKRKKETPSAGCKKERIPCVSLSLAREDDTVLWGGEIGKREEFAYHEQVSGIVMLRVKEHCRA